MVTQTGNLSVFSLTHVNADQVYLQIDAQIDARQLSPSLMKMDQISHGQWQLEIELTPGTYRYRYYIKTGTTFLYHSPCDDTNQSIDQLDAELTIPENPASLSA